jgi:hypothetical protein
MTSPPDRPVGSGAGDSPDGLLRIAEAIHLYLGEVQADAELCQRHEATIAVADTGHALATHEAYACSGAVEARVQQAAAALPSWQESPWWRGEGARWEQMKRALRAKARDGPGGRHPVIFRAAAWEGRPVLIQATALNARAALVLGLHFPHVPAALPELSLRTAARALRCHEQLAPGAVARPLVPFLNGPKYLTIREYLRRTMPQNLYASQCFFHGSAEY